MKLLKFLIITVFGLGIFAYVMTVYISGQHSAPVFLTPIPTPTNLNADELFQLVNDWRTQNGYQPYIQDERLCKIALDRVNDPQPDFHRGFLAKYSNYPYVIQENTAENFQNETATLNGWLGSPPHLATLKKPYKDSCIKCYQLVCDEIFSSFKTDRNNPY